MIVLRNSLCQVPPPEFMFASYDKLIFVVAESGRAALERDGKVLRLGYDRLKWHAEEVGLGFNLHMDHDLSLMEDCAVGEVE